MKPAEFVYCNESIPHHMWEPLTGYVERHEPVGHFLRALLSNDLREACVRADNSNIRVLHVYVAFLDSHAEPACWGSPQKVEAWLAARPHACRVCGIDDGPTDFPHPAGRTSSPGEAPSKEGGGQAANHRPRKTHESLAPPAEPAEWLP